MSEEETEVRRRRDAMTMTTTRDDPDAMTEGLTTTRAKTREKTREDRAPAAPVFGAAFASGGFGAKASGGFDPSKFASSASATTEAKGGEGAEGARDDEGRRGGVHQGV